jgi:hypothetical protein
MYIRGYVEIQCRSKLIIIGEYGGALEELNRADRDAVAAEARRVFALNEVDMTQDYFHMPNWEFYPSMFAWDSAYHAVTMLHIDPDKAKRELETLFRQVSADGHMPHEVLIPCPATRAQPIRNVMRWIARRHYDSLGASRLVDPPIYVYAALLVFERTGDRQWLGRIWKNLCRCLDYLLEERDLFGDGLVSILHPWEAGTDLSLQLLPALGIDPSRRSDSLQATTYAVLLDRFCNRFNWDPEALKAENRFVVEDLTVNCITIRALDSAAALAMHADDEPTVRRYRSRAALMAEALESVCWDEAAGCYYPRWDARAPRLARVKSAASLLPLFTGRCEPARAERLIADHLLDPGEFWAEYLLPFNAHDELAGVRPWVENKLWCGHCIWINFNWMMAIALVENGRVEEARELTSRTVKMILREGFWEYYDSRTGAGRRIRDFNWPGLALDMISRCT